EGMGVTIGALEARAEKDLGGGFGAGDRIASRAEVIASEMIVRAAASGEQLARELIERLIGGDAFTNPAVKDLHAFAVKHLFFVAEQVGPFQRPKIRKLRTVEKRVDQPSAFLLPTVDHEIARFIGRG